MMEEQKNAKSEFAIASLALGIASFFSLAGMEKAILAVVFGAMALKRIEKDSQLLGKKLAKAGVILGIASIIITITFLIKFYPRFQRLMNQIQMQSEDRLPGAGGSQQLNQVPQTKLY